MSNVGTQLRKAREAQNKTRADVAGETGILIHHLAALEHGSFNALPDDETVAGFVKAYAEHLGFHAGEPVAEFWAERGIEPPPSETAPAPEPAESTSAPEPEIAGTRSVKRVWVLAAGVVLVIAVVWLATRSDRGPTPVAPEPAEPSAQESTPSTSDEAPARDPEPVAPREPVSTTSEPAATTLRVTEHRVGSGVRNRELSGATSRFGLGDRVWFWTRVRGGGAGDEILHVWIHEGREISSVELDIGNANWRTWSVKTMFAGSAGRWAVEARDASGGVLARSEFVSQP